MKTVMQELIEWVNVNDLKLKISLYNNELIDKLKELQEKEKEQIIEISKNSYIAGYLDNQCKVDESMNFPEEYYNQTYNKNK